MALARFSRIRGVTSCFVPIRGSAGVRGAQKATAKAAARMNVQNSYTLASPPQSSRLLRGWALLSRGTFASAIFLIDVATIIAMSFVTGVAYYLIVYGDIDLVASNVKVGVLAASIFA